MRSTASECLAGLRFGPIAKVALVLCCLPGVGCGSSGDTETDGMETQATSEPMAQGPDTGEGLAAALSFHASFDAGPDADFGSGDRSIYSASSYQDISDPTPGIHVPDVEIVDDGGRFGSALRFGSRNTQALFYRARDHVPYSADGMAGTVSFWLSLDPAVDLEPGFSDPIQLTDVAYNDAAVWVDFTSENPRQFRLGVFGDLGVWNPDNLPPAGNPLFEDRLVVVDEPPFGSGRWTHVVITYSGLNAPDGGTASLYLDGQLEGTADGIGEAFTWDLDRATIRLGVNYVGLYDELAIFNRALAAAEVLALHELRTGVAELY